MKKHYTIPILFKIDEQTLGKLDKAIDELGHTRSLFHAYPVDSHTH